MANLWNNRLKRFAQYGLTSRLCETAFAVTRDTTTRDFELLMKLGIARRLGKSRSTCYVLVTFA